MRSSNPLNCKNDFMTLLVPLTNTMTHDVHAQKCNTAAEEEVFSGVIVVSTFY